MKKLIVLAIAVMLVVAAVNLGAEVKFPSTSQKATVTQTVGLTDVTVVYHRPGVKKRTIWGDLVPYDKVWRTGANEATSIEFSTDVEIEGTKVAAGKYAIFTIPGKAEWTFIISKQTELWGEMGYKESEDVLRVKVKPMAAPHCEWMAFGFADLSDTGARVVLRWEKVMVGFKFSAATKEIVLGNIEKTMGRYWVTPYRAAEFAFKGEMLDKAKGWINSSTSIKAVYWNMLLKSKIYKAMAKTKKDKKMVIKMLEKTVSLIPELPEGQKKYAVEAGKLLKELKNK